MRAVVVRQHGGPETLELRDVPEPAPGPGELLVEVRAAGVNFVDVYQRTGVYPTSPPFVLGGEGAGQVVALGQGVTRFSVGDHVAWATAPGSYAEKAVVPVDEAVPVPPGVDDELAAASMLQGLTAHYLCTSTFPVADGEWVVVHAAAGGVGGLLTQMVRMRGGHVVATASTAAKQALGREAGADDVVGYDAFVDTALGHTDQIGVAAVFDGVGRATFDDSLTAIRPRGMMVLYGAASGQVPPFDAQRLNRAGSLFLTRPTLGNYIATREELLQRSNDLFGWVAGGRLRVRIGGRYSLADAHKAHEDLEARRTTGKLILEPQG